MATHEKKVDTWWYNLRDILEKLDKPADPADENEEPKTSARFEERKIPVEVYLVKKMDEAKTPPHPVEDVHFVVKCRQEKELGIQFTLEGPDISALQAEAWAKLDKRFEIKWFEYYLVTISPARVYDGIGDGLELSYKSVWKGITWEGKELLKEYHRGRDYDDSYRIRPWPGKFTRRDGRVIACIPENDVTKSALEEFCKKIVLVRDALEKMVAPETIMNTLTNISGLRLIQESNAQVSEEEKEKDERKKKAARNG